MEPPGFWEITRWLWRTRYRVIGLRPMLLFAKANNEDAGTALSKSPLSTVAQRTGQNV